MLGGRWVRVSCAREHVLAISASCSFETAWTGLAGVGLERQIHLSGVSVAEAVIVSRARAWRRWDEPMAYSKSNSIAALG